MQGRASLFHFPAMSRLQYRCPSCFSKIKHRRNLIDHFNSHPACPYRAPDDCLSEDTVSDDGNGSPPPQSSSSQSSPTYETGNYHNEDPESYIDNDDDVLGVEADPNYPSVASNLILQEDSDLTDDDEDEYDGPLTASYNDNDIFGTQDAESGTPTYHLDLDLPTPINQWRRIDEEISVHPVEESLLCLLTENHLPKRMYSALMEWAHYASEKRYDFTNAPMYQTVLCRMIRKYMYVSGGPPTSEIVRVPDHAPMHVYRFDFLKQVTRLLSSHDLMESSLWGYNPQVHADTGERVYAEMNTGDYWKLGQDYIESRVSHLRLTERDELPHRLCPVIIFIDSTLVDRIGRLKVEPVLCSIGNISGSKRSAASSWFILGLIPPNPKSSKEVELDRKSVHTRHLQARYYQSCVKSIFKELLEIDKMESGHKMWVPSQGWMWVHFKLSLIIGDTEGHDKVCCHYCSYSSNIQRMSRDCNIPQSLGDNPNAQCEFIRMEDIKDEVRECTLILTERRRGQVGLAEKRLAKISQLPVWSTMFDFDFCGCPHGVFASCPFERLHAWQTGIMKDAMKNLFLMSDLPQNFLSWYNDRDATPSSRPNVNITDSQLFINKPKFEAVFRYLTMCSRRQSDREVPRTPFRNGVTDLT